MATANVGICIVCTEDYNFRHRQSVSLPCGHDFCLSCLVRLRASGKHMCPNCRRNWAGVNLQTQLGMEALAVALQADQEEDEEKAGKKTGKADRCEKHSMPYDFWVNAKKQFYCRKCASEDKSHVKLELIEDAIPQVKAALAANFPAEKKKVQNYIKTLDERHAELIRKKNSVSAFMNAVLTLDDNFDQVIEQVATSRANAVDASVEIEKVERKINKIKSPADLDVAMECTSVLKKVAACSSVPASELSQTLLSDIACSYVQEEVPAESSPSRASFIATILRGGVTDPSVGSAASAASTKAANTMLFSTDTIAPYYKIASSRILSPDYLHPYSVNQDYVNSYINPYPVHPYLSSASKDPNLQETTSDNTSALSKYRWQYQTVGAWNTYETTSSAFQHNAYYINKYLGRTNPYENTSTNSSTTSDEIENYYLKRNGQGTMIGFRGRTFFLLDFKMMIEVCIETGIKKTIRRVPI